MAGSDGIWNKRNTDPKAEKKYQENYDKTFGKKKPTYEKKADEYINIKGKVYK